MSEMTDEDKVMAFDWIIKRISGTVKDGMFDDMYENNRELYNKFYPPEEDEALKVEGG